MLIINSLNILPDARYHIAVEMLSHYSFCQQVYRSVGEEVAVEFIYITSTISYGKQNGYRLQTKLTYLVAQLSFWLSK